MESALRVLPARTLSYVSYAVRRSSPGSQAGGGAAGPPFPPADGGQSDDQWLDSWTARAARLERIRDAASDEQKLWAIQTLEREAAFVQRHFPRSGNALDETYGMYYRRLALFVAALQDERAVESLAVATDVSPAIGLALAEFGADAAACVLSTMETPLLSESAAFTMEQILRRAKERQVRFESPLLRAMRTSLLAALTAGGPSLQACAVRALAQTKLTPDELRVLRVVERRTETAPSVREVILALLPQ